MLESNRLAFQHMTSPSAGAAFAAADEDPTAWPEVARLLLLSRALDELEEKELVPKGLVRYQFSARGHELAQILLARSLDHAHDGATVYYRSRPFMLAAGLRVEEALAASMARAGSPSGGRDIGVVFNMPSRGAVSVLPVTGDVGGQYTPAAGWAQTICYRRTVLREQAWDTAIAVVLGGDGSVATPGFWAALNIATTQALPLLFLIEDNGYAISVPSTVQVPGGDIVANLRSYHGLHILDGDGADPSEAASLIRQAVTQLRAGSGPVLLRLRVPRLNGHSFTDNQGYKHEAERIAEWQRDPLPRLRNFMLGEGWSEKQWDEFAAAATGEARAALERALQNPEPDPATTAHFLFAQPGAPQGMGGLHDQQATRNPAPKAAIGIASQAGSVSEGDASVRINMVDAIRRTLQHEMRHNPRMLLFGEDVGRKGGVHGATRDLQREFGAGRVFDTSLNEEGIIGRAVGMALAGLLPVPEIQFRKYLDPAMEQVADCGTIRWRTNNNWAAPMVVRIPVGFSKHVGDPWHSISGEANLARMLGWKVVMPSNAADAAGLLRSALRGGDPVFFLEHRARLDSPEGRRPYPGDDYTLPLGLAVVKQTGDALTVLTWGAMVQRCLDAAKEFAGAVEIIDLRTIMPWDRATILQSVQTTGRCLIVHEDTASAGWGAEIAATIAQDAFAWLDAPVSRLTTPDCPIPYNAGLMHSIVPTVALIRERIDELLKF